MKITICITTYKRPIALDFLLKKIKILNVKEGYLVNVLIIDNDENKSAWAIYNMHKKSFPFPIYYVLEKRRGISYARNSALKHSIYRSDFIIFIDDDEYPEKEWLNNLLETQKKYNADIVTGPVLSVFEEKPPTWIEQGGFFNRRRFKTGTRVEYVATGNVLIKTSILLEQNGYFFDNRYALSGGEDTHFFMRLKKQGYSMYWCDEAIVYEKIPKSRVNIKWLVQRSFRLGNTIAFCEIELYPRKKLLVRIIKAFGSIFLGIIQVLFQGVFDKKYLVKGLQRLARGAGSLAGIFNIRYLEYKSIHGS